MTTRAALVTLGVVALAGMLGMSCSPAAGAQRAGVRSDISALTPGKGVKIKFSDKPVKLPDFSIQDINGKTIAPADWAGKVVLINFWATWCGPCRSEIPELIEFQKHYANELVIVGLSVDEGSPADVKKFAAENGMNYTVATRTRRCSVWRRDRAGDARRQSRGRNCPAPRQPLHRRHRAIHRSRSRHAGGD